MRLVVWFGNRIRPVRTSLIVVSDVAVIAVSFISAFQLRFDFSIPPEHWERFLFSIPIVLIVRVAAFYWFRLHTGLWRYISLPDFREIFKAVTLSSVVILAVIVIFLGHGFPRWVLFVDWLLCLVLISGTRLAIRMLRESYWEQLLGGEAERRKRVLIIGAGDVGEMLLRDISRNQSGSYDVVGFVDDDPRKAGVRIHGCEVLGGVEEMVSICKEKGVEELIIALPTLNHEDRRRILKQCWETGLPFKTVPPVDAILQGTARVNQLQEIEAEDILGREPLKLDLGQLRGEFEGKCVLVTGAGGSIGSELCRQLGELAPKRLVLYERSESSLFFLEHDLKRLFPSVQFASVIGDILDRKALDGVISANAPEFLFHAAAYKHVPLMEAHPIEAVRNNVFGSEAVGEAAVKGGVRKVVFVSTDKAVRPASIMGMTKRLSECMLQILEGSTTKFVAVRFGNVIGSEGSVVPLFLWQMSKGMPVTVTDARATRYFMLISEAAKLIIQAGVSGEGGEIFFLDMGEPVRIMSLAQNLIRLSGSVPDREVPIVISGLRPGEKLREDLALEREELFSTEHEKIFKVRSRPFEHGEFRRDLETLRRLADERDKEGLQAFIREITDKY